MKHHTELKELFVKRDYQETSIVDQFNCLNHQKQQTKKEGQVSPNSFGCEISDLTKP